VSCVSTWSTVSKYTLISACPPFFISRILSV
jgi:hypothetical protein